MTMIMNGYAAQVAPTKANRFHLKYFNFGLYAVLAVIGAFYLININELTVSGFSLRDLKSQAATLASIKLENEEAVNSAQSYHALSARTKNLNMVAIGDAEYLTLNGGVAMARK